jgi:hypothetical protein
VALVVPTLPEIKTYLGTAHSWEDTAIEEAYDTELEAQADVCRLPDDGPYPKVLRDALGRRVAHNLAVRELPLGVQATISDMAVATRSVGGLDPEVQRLEGPRRKVILG